MLREARDPAISKCAAPPRGGDRERIASVAPARRGMMFSSTAAIGVVFEMRFSIGPRRRATRIGCHASGG